MDAHIRTMGFVALVTVTACKDDAGMPHVDEETSTTSDTAEPPASTSSGSADATTSPGSSAESSDDGRTTGEDSSEGGRESSDDGESSSESGVVGVCGDGIVEGAEVCDDGNPVVIDGCTDACELTPDLLAYWRFDEDEAATTLADETGMYDAELERSPDAALSGLYPGEGRNGAALLASWEESSAVAAGPIASIDAGTIAVWVRNYLDVGAAERVVFWQGVAGGDGWDTQQEMRLGINADGTLSFRMYACVAETQLTTFEGDSWLHVIASWEQDIEEMDCSISVADSASPLETIVSSGPLQLEGDVHDAVHIGRADSEETPRWFRGYVDELMVFGRRLTSIEIASLRNVQAEGGHYD